MELLCLVAGVIIGGLCGYGFARPAIKKQTIYNEEIAKQNKQLEIVNQEYKRQERENKYLKKSIEEEIKGLEDHKLELIIDVGNLNQELVIKRQNLQDLSNQAKQAGDIFYEENMNLARERLNNALEKIRNEFNQEKENYEREYLIMLSDFTSVYQNIADEQQEKIAQSTFVLNELKNKVAAAVEVNKRAELERTQKDFYKLVLTDEDIAEIGLLRQATQTIRNKEPINKVIWKVYYEKPYTDLIGRVIGNKVKTGIYKITNLENGMCYVGQAVHIADRWKQHIKRGIGAEPLTRNKLYPAMLSIGVENFSFEIIEECDRSQLNEREDYWQNFYKAKEFGYSIK